GMESIMNIKYSGFSDEISQNIDEQFTHLNKLGIRYFEPRGINGTNIASLTEEQLAELKGKMEEYGISASSIGSPIGKIQITDPMEPHLEQLKWVIHIAKALGTRFIRVFSFFMPKGEDPACYREEVMRRMKQMVALAEQEDVVLLHENEKGIYGDTALRCKEIFDEIPSEHLKGVFDPANFVQCGDITYPDGFQLLKEHIVYMHIKDALEDGSIVPAGQGKGRVEDILRELSEDGYQGFLSLEPHLGSFEGLAELEQEDTMMKLSKSDSGKFTLAYESLKKIVDRL
ncbi:MAG: sugar phosphate isomerase/epimerase family protein, partial [Clostridia bacterium]|nr:sugar phosphate isomerase/epimerase family protein [Clostridia bacterium]